MLLGTALHNPPTSPSYRASKMVAAIVNLVGWPEDTMQRSSYYFTFGPLVPGQRASTQAP